jgi:DNA-binding CsgD family transcriptional regulator
MEIRTKVVVFYEEGIRSAREIGETYNISERTVNFDQQYNYWRK